MNKDVEYISHLMRRAGFGATLSELDKYCDDGYENTLNWLLNPGEPGDFSEDLARRRAVGFDEGGAAFDLWMNRIIHTNNPLEEKMALFFHSLFPVEYMSQGRALLNQLDTFRKHCLGSFEDMLVALSKDPAMLLYLNNNDNHGNSMNENYGRELIELFSMGVGNYNETDVKQCARALTGWTLGNADYMAVRAGKNSFDPYGSISWHFEYRADDHDNGLKTFLGETGNFDGEDICQIIARQPATARFICKRLFQFFAADKVDDSSRKTIDLMVETYYDSKYEIKSVLRTLFTSEFFKSERSLFARVKGPVELVTGAIRLTESSPGPESGTSGANGAAQAMGQGVFRPPSVEGWHEGKEWIESGALVQRVNYVSNLFRNRENSGVRQIVSRVVGNNSEEMTVENIVDNCLNLMGPMRLSKDSRMHVIDYAGSNRYSGIENLNEEELEVHISQILGLIAATPEYQFG